LLAWRTVVDRERLQVGLKKVAVRHEQQQEKRILIIAFDSLPFLSWNEYGRAYERLKVGT
jgi:hypothetical protein